MLHDAAYIRFYRFLVSFTALLVLVSLPGVVIFELFPDSFSIWRVSNLDINPSNPVITRHEWGDFDYAMYFYTTVIPVDWSSDSQRYPLIFTEPTYYGAYVIAPFFLAVYDAKSARDWLVVILLLIGLLLSSSYLALMLALASLVVGYLVINLKLGSPRLLLLLVVLAPLYLLAFPSVFFFLLELVPGDKVSEFQGILIRGAFSLPEELSLFGAKAPEATQNFNEVKDYGATALLGRYGLVGTFAFVFLLLIYVYRSFDFLYRAPVKKRKRLTGFAALFCCTCMAIKVPQYLLLSSMLTYYYLVYSTTRNSNSVTESIG